MPRFFVRIKESLPFLINAIVQGWFRFTPAMRVALSASATFLVVMIVFVFFLQYKLRQQPIQVVETKQITKTIVATKEEPSKKEKEKVVIESTDQAIEADAFGDDNTVIVTKREISEQEMFRISNDWLYPQVQELKKRVTQIKSSIEQDERYLSENAPLIEPIKQEIVQLEKDYQRASAALDLPRLSNGSFNDEMEQRYQGIRQKLTSARNKLKALEQVVSTIESRKKANEQSLPELEVEASDLNDRLQKVYAHDRNALAITYQYATSGIKTLPILRFIGNGFWNLGMLKELKVAYRGRFQRDLPVSAFGQSETHNRLGWDHTNAADVALHPGTQEGQWLVTYLKSHSIPFIAFRSAVRGHSTGPHVHIGLRSHRLR
jgi:hypothetical protein